MNHKIFKSFLELIICTMMLLIVTDIAGLPRTHSSQVDAKPYGEANHLKFNYDLLSDKFADNSLINQPSINKSGLEIKASSVAEAKSSHQPVSDLRAIKDPSKEIDPDEAELDLIKQQVQEHKLHGSELNKHSQKIPIFELHFHDKKKEDVDEPRIIKGYGLGGGGFKLG